MAWRYNVLVVANVTGRSPELIQALKDRAGDGACGFTLLVPATGGGSEGRRAAREKLQTALERMRAEDLDVDGMIGDPDPTIAVSDVWDPARFDEVIVSTLPTGTSRWLAIDLPRRIEKMTGVPVRHVVAQPEPRELKIEPAPKPEHHHPLLAPFAALMPSARRAARAKRESTRA